MHSIEKDAGWSNLLISGSELPALETSLLADRLN